MFDIGWSELLVIAVVALIAIGPKELPGVLRSVGHWMGKIRRMASEFQSQFQEAMREAEMEDLKKHADDLNNAARSLSKPFDPADYLGNLDTPSAEKTADAATGSSEAATSGPANASAGGADASPAQPAPEPPVSNTSTDGSPADPGTVTPAAGPAEAGGRAA